MSNTDDDLRKNIQMLGGYKIRKVKGVNLPESVLSARQVDDVIALIEQEKLKARKDEIEFLYAVADDDLKDRLRQKYKLRGQNMGLCFIKSQLNSNSQGRK